MAKYKNLLIAGVSLLVIVAIVLSIVFTGGRNNDKANIEGTLNIRMWEGGFGKEYLENVIDAFEKKNINVKVNLSTTTLRLQAATDMLMTKQFQKYDLFFTDYAAIFKVASTPNYVSGEKEAFVDLADVYDYKWEGESKSIRQKMNQGMVDYSTFNDKMYFMHYGASSYGITYLPEFLKGYIQGQDLPRTTSELVGLCNWIKINMPDKYPFIFSGDTDYWNQIFNSWWAQYEGIDKFDQFYTGKIDVFDEDTGAFLREEYSSDVFAQVGILRSYEAIDSLLNYSKGFIDPQSVGYQYMQAQNKYLSGNAVMMVNGSWLETEMKDIFEGSFPFEVDMMHLPVISSIIEKCATIADDAELSALIKAIDSKNTALQGPGYDVSQQDFDKVYEARNMMYIGNEMAFANIPSTSKNIPLAKEFLKFLFSDEGIDAYVSSAAGCILPLSNYSYKEDSLKNYTRLMKTSLEMMNNIDWLYIKRDNPMVYNANIEAKRPTTIEKCFGSIAAKDRYSPLKIYTDAIQYYKESNGAAWQAMLQAAGLLG